MQIIRFGGIDNAQDGHSSECKTVHRRFTGIDNVFLWTFACSKLEPRVIIGSHVHLSGNAVFTNLYGDNAVKPVRPA